MEQQVNNTIKPSLLGIITSPVETLDRIRQNPKVLIPLLFVTILAVISTVLGTANIDFVEMGLNQGLSKQEAEMMAGFTKVFVIVTGIISPVFVILITSLIYLSISKIAGSYVKFKQLFSMTTYTSIIGGLGILLNAIIAYFMGTSLENVNYTSVNSLIGLEGVPGALLSYIEVFGIWGTILLAMGLHRVAKLSKGASWTIAIIFYIIGAIFAIVGGVSQGMIGG